MSRFRAYDEETAAEAAPSAAWAPDDEDSSSFDPVTPLGGYIVVRKLVSATEPKTSMMIQRSTRGKVAFSPEVVLNECVPYFLLKGVRPEVDGKFCRRCGQRATDREIFLPEIEIQYFIHEYDH